MFFLSLLQYTTQHKLPYKVGLSLSCKFDFSQQLRKSLRIEIPKLKCNFGNYSHVKPCIQAYFARFIYIKERECTSSTSMSSTVNKTVASYMHSFALYVKNTSVSRKRAGYSSTTQSNLLCNFRFILQLVLCDSLVAADLKLVT